MKKSKTILCTAAALIVGSGVGALAEGGWITGDFHQHSLHSDGSEQMSIVFQKSNQFGLSWWANSEHGGTNRWKDLMGWNNTKWKTTLDNSWTEVQNGRSLYPTKTLIQGVEWNVPGHEHGSVGIVTNEFGASANGKSIAEFEYKFGNGGSDSDAAALGWTKTSATGHAKTLEGLTWLQANHQYTSWMVPAHPERAKSYTVADFRDMNNAAKDVCFGFESMPGHQSSSGRGGYGTGVDGGGTYGGCGVYAAKVGGLWDAMLGEGRRFWLFANSDYHNTSGDFYPGEYQKNYTYVKEKGTPNTAEAAQAIVNGLRSGNAFVTEGDLIDALDFRISTATMGEVLRGSGNNISISIKVHDPAGMNNVGTSPILDHFDLIAGDVTGFISPSDSAAYSNATNSSSKVIARFDASGNIADSTGLVSTAWIDGGDGWKEVTYSFNLTADSMYFRLRGTNQSLVGGEVDGAGNPLLDLQGNTAAMAASDVWFYSNPIFVTSVPEPSSIIALLSGVIGLGGIAIRRKR